MTGKTAGADDPAVASVDMNTWRFAQPGPDCLHICKLAFIYQINQTPRGVVVDRCSVFGDAACEAESPTAVDDLAEAASGGNDGPVAVPHQSRSEEHTSELQSRGHLVCRLLLE